MKKNKKDLSLSDKLALASPFTFLLVFGFITFHHNNPKPTYKIGECFQDDAKELESWEKDTSFTYKVIMIGKAHYGLIAHENGSSVVIPVTTSFEGLPSYTHKVECPKLFDQVK